MGNGPNRTGKRPFAAARLGAAAEELACKFLAANGYCILDRNVRSGSGELDVVARHGQVIAFVEVKCRASKAGLMTAAAENVTRRKQLSLRTAALRYLASRGLLPDVECRFDVVLVTGAGRPGAARFMLLKDAF